LESFSTIYVGIFSMVLRIKLGILSYGDRIDATMCHPAKANPRDNVTITKRIPLNHMPINCYSRLPHRVKQAQKISLRELHTKGPLASVAMASVQCFKKAEKSYYQQNRRGQRSEHAKSHAEWYGQREDHFSLHRGSTAVGYGYSAKGHGDMARAQGLGHKVQAQSAYSSGLATVESQNACKGRNNGHYLSQFDQNHSKSQSNGRYLAQQAQTQSMTEFHGNQREFSSCQAKAKKKTEHRKKEKFMMMHREFRTRDKRCSDGSGSESESDNDRW